MTDPQKLEVDYRLVRWHVLAALVTLAVSVLFGLAVATKLPLPEFLGGSAWATWGRLRYNHTQGIFFGWLGNAFLAFLYYAVPVLAGRPVASRRLGWILFWLWNGAVVLPGWTLVCAGFSQPLEWAEFPLVVDAMVLLAFGLMIVEFVTPFLRARAGNLYVSAWYIIGGIIFTALAYPIGNVVPELVPGAMGASFSGLWIHDAIGLYVTPLALAIAYYVIPAATGRPIYSHFLSLLGFWLLFFFYPLNGTHHYIYSSVPMAAQKGAVYASVLLGFDVILVVANLLVSLRGSSALVGQDLSLRFVWTGVICYLVVSLQGSLQAIMPVNRFIHFSDWVIGHSHLALFGFASFIAIGGVTYLWRKLPGASYNERWISWSFWLLATGLVLMVADLTMAGMVEGTLWNSSAPWIDSVRAAHSYWLVRALTGLPVLAGLICLWCGLTREQQQPMAVSRPAPQVVRPVLAPAVGFAHLLESFQVLAFVAGVGFFLFSFFLLGVVPSLALRAEIRNTQPMVLPALTTLERQGRAVYGREGCAYCHTQQVRFVAADEDRFGAPTAAWETRLEYPQLWGTRRIGPDLAREFGQRPADWQLTHLYNPRAAVPDSVMPAYPWLFEGDPAKPTAEGMALLAYLRALGQARALAAPEQVDRRFAGPAPSIPVAATTAGPGTPAANGLDSVATLERAAGLFRRNCAGCHGESGRGDGPAAAGLLPRPADLTGSAFSVQRLSHVLWQGVPGTAMPAWQDLPQPDLAALTIYVKGLHRSPAAWKSEGDAGHGAQLFQENCVACHGPDGRGDGPVAASLAPPPANFHGKQRNADRIARVLANGIAGTAMPPWPRLSAQDRRDLAAYLASLPLDAPPEAGE